MSPISSIAPPSMAVSSPIVPAGAEDAGRGMGTVPATVCVLGRLCSASGDVKDGKGVDRDEDGSRGSSIELVRGEIVNGEETEGSSSPGVLSRQLGP